MFCFDPAEPLLLAVFGILLLCGAHAVRSPLQLRYGTHCCPWSAPARAQSMYAWSTDLEEAGSSGNTCEVAALHYLAENTLCFRQARVLYGCTCRTLCCFARVSRTPAVCKHYCAAACFDGGVLPLCFSLRPLTCHVSCRLVGSNATLARKRGCFCAKHRVGNLTMPCSSSMVQSSFQSET